MAPNYTTSNNPVYEDYDPPSDVVTEQDCDTILIYLPGYKKEQLKVQLTTSGMLKISGQRPINNNDSKLRRFHKEFKVPTNCDTKGITAKFEGGILHIRQPKQQQPPPPPPDHQPPKTDPPQPQQPPPQPRPQPQSQSQPQNDEELKEKKSEIIAKNDDDEQGNEEQEERPKQEKGSLGFLRELRKPENLKKLVISVVIVLSIGFYVTYMFKSFLGDDEDSLEMEL